MVQLVFICKMIDNCVLYGHFAGKDLHYRGKSPRVLIQDIVWIKWKLFAEPNLCRVNYACLNNWNWLIDGMINRFHTEQSVNLLFVKFFWSWLFEQFAIKAETFIFVIVALKNLLIFKDPCKFRTLATEYFPNCEMCFVLRVIIIER